MFKKSFRKYRRYRYDHRYDYPVMFFSISVAVVLLKVLAVAGGTYALYVSVTQFL